ncbi:MAG: FAD-dependent oxidoreductase [Candidatus Dormibacteria bacterium]
MTERLVVIGSDAAGMSAASQARRRRGPENLEIAAFERGHHTSYSACGIPYFVAGVVGDVDALVARRPEVFRDQLAIDVHLCAEAVDIDVGRRLVRVRALDTGHERDEPFDHLMVATGATPVRPLLPGSEAQGIFGVQTLDDGEAVRCFVAAESPRRAVVVGGGYIGLEMAEALVMRGLQVTLVTAGSQPMTTLDPDMGSHVADALAAVGVRLILGQRVEGFDTSADRVRGVVTDGVRLPADLVVLGLGVRPNASLAEAAGIPLGPSGGIAVDRRMRTGVAGVWAAGDCVESFHRVSRRPVVVALGTHANKQGRVAGINLGGGYATFPGVIGTAISKICGAEVARTGLTEAEATDAGFDHVAVVVGSTTRAGYYPGAAAMRTKLVAERRSGRLLGAQIVGGEGSAKRIDALAVAVWNEMTVEEMTGLDLAYAPPFSPVWDPVLIAARKAAEAVEEAMSV